MKLGIVGHDAKKFGPRTEELARKLINNALDQFKPDEVISGGCHFGGIDIWAVEEALKRKISTTEFFPKYRCWTPQGYRERNLRIAQESDLVLNFVVDDYPVGYKGMRFSYCYHCNATDHIKSGGCWTASKAKKGTNIIIHQLD